MDTNDKNERIVHDNRGKFAPGNCANPNGRPRNAEPELLRQALIKEGIKRGEDFWQKVAEYAFRDKAVMIAVIKKFVPDQIEGKGFATDIRQYIIQRATQPLIEHKAG